MGADTPELRDAARLRTSFRLRPMAAPAALPGAAAAEPAVVVTTREPGGDESACPGQFWKRGWKSTAALTIGKPPRAPRV